MRITKNTPINVAVAEVQRRWAHRAEQVCRTQGDRATSDESRTLWHRIADALAGDGTWVACYNDTQWDHCSQRAAIYLTIVGYEWEVFGVARATNIETLAEAKCQAEEAMR